MAGHIRSTITVSTKNSESGVNPVSVESGTPIARANIGESNGPDPVVFLVLAFIGAWSE